MFSDMKDWIETFFFTEISLHEAKGDYATGWQYLKSTQIYRLTSFYTASQQIKVIKSNESFLKTLQWTLSDTL